MNSFVVKAMNVKGLMHQNCNTVGIFIISYIIVRRSEDIRLFCWYTTKCNLITSVYPPFYFISFLYLNKRLLNCEEWLTVGMSYVMLPAVLCIWQICVAYVIFIF